MSTLETYLKERKVLWNVMMNESTEDVIKWYNKNSEMYDQHFPNAGFQYQQYVVDAVVDYVPNKNATILDLGAGTGNIGAMLFEHGYSTIDALDASEEMLAIAKEKKVYRLSVLAMIGTEKIKGLTEDAYDVIVGGGLFSVGTVQYDSIPILTSYAKKGGHIIFNVSEESMIENPNLNTENLEKLSSQWEQKNVCKLVEKKTAYHINNEPATVFVLRKM